ncbi:uncharacterized protein LOC107327733 [Rhizophagus irregularis DAOM 181602=DAOM 197198]|nr:uncharacterized protein LOC107327733 [Rhizophagus irregularis DAOM 181602=DAOM 197198]
MKYYLSKYFEILRNIKLCKITEYYESSNYGTLRIIEFRNILKIIFRNILKSYKILRLRKLAAGLKTYEILCKITKYCEPQNYGILQIVKLRSFAYRNILKYFKKLRNITLTQTCGGFVPCPKCHKLYKKEEVVDFKQEDNPAIMKCQHIEFTNSSVRRSCLCNTALSEKISASTNRTIIRPNLMYPFAGINQQLATMFCRPGSEVADFHLGLMLNLDWFQPYDSTIYSIGVIYAAICNLPRDIRFRRENLLTLGILPGPKEVSLHKVNHYLAPIVNELETLWAGLTLNRTYECENGKRVRGALILVSCDIPATRKICGHVSALVSCHRCEKKANYENGQHNFAGMDDVGYSARDSNEHRQNALGWRRCNSDAARKRFVKETGVRWSELLRLSYFDPIRFITVDPMHCLFLGIAKWIVKRIWIDGGILTPNSLNKIQKKIDEFQIPSDLGRIPGKIHSGEGFTNFTADQWQIFFTIYSTVSLWEHLSDVDRRILDHFVRVCSILVNWILESNLVDEVHRSLIEIVKLIENHHGRDKITPNLHLSLHLRDCSSDYGPLYAFWCFSFERMNGILGSLPNSNRKIESELMRRLVVRSGYLFIRKQLIRESCYGYG